MSVPQLSCTRPYTENSCNGPLQLNPPHPFRFTFGHHPDALKAFDIQRARATANGQRWSEAHANAIRELHQAYVLTGLGMSEGRRAWPLAVGTGKSESVVAFVKAQHERAARGLQPLTLLVCMERAAQLTDLYQSILSTGVPASFVGVFHRKSTTEVEVEGLTPSVELAEVDSYTVLLATHAKMLRGDTSIAQVNTFNGQPRSLVVWDESLIKSRGYHLDLAKIEAANAVLGTAVSDTVSDDLRDAHAFLSGRLSTLRAAFKAGTAEPVTFPALADGDELRFTTALAAVLLKRSAGDMERGAHENLSAFLEHAQRPLRVLPYVEAGRRVGVIRFDTLIPPSLTRLIVLDASHNIRLLTGEHDGDLKVTSVDCAVKSFEGVTVRHLQRGAGKGTLADALPRSNSVLLREIVGEVKAWPVDQAGIVVTFKQRPSDVRRGKLAHAEYIRMALTAAGVDVDAKLTNGKARLSFITWGQHLGVNHYSHATNVLLVGVLRRTPLDLSSAIAGQRGDLSSRHAADPEEVRRVELSEMFHNVIQAAGRGSCRHTVNGRAPPMCLAFICNDTFPEEWWQSAMPGVKVAEWDAKHAKPERVHAEREQGVLGALAKLSQRETYVSARALKSLAGLDGLPPPTSTRILQRAAQRASGWTYDSARRDFTRDHLTFQPEDGYTAA